jgi:hypothetical protein
MSLNADRRRRRSLIGLVRPPEKFSKMKESSMR